MLDQFRTRRRLLGVLAVFALLMTACGDDDDTNTTDDTETDDTTTDDTGEDIGEDTSGDDEMDDGGDEMDDAAGTVSVTAVDFGFEGLPDSVPSGTTIELMNSSAGELHEFVAIKLPDDEERPVSELVQLPQEELEALLGPNVTDVIVALPGSTDVPGAVEGDGVLDESGRYAILCFIPTGIEPQVYLDAAQEAEGGPPEVEGGGPPHFVQGMFTELVVE